MRNGSWRLLIVGVLIVGACGRGAPDHSADVIDTAVGDDAVETTAPTPTTPPGVRADLEERLKPLVIFRPLEELEATIDAMVATGDPSWAPYLVDLLRVEFLPEALDVVEAGLAELTGIPPGVDQIESYVAYGRWMLDRDIDPGAAYVPWKSGLYGQISIEFQDLLAGFDPVTAAKVQWGGVGFAGIPELNDPPLADPSTPSYLIESELVFGAVIDGEARTYPLRILDFHEMANDTLGGVPVALANCTLCRSGILYDRRVGGQTLDFATSGLLLNSNKLMVDFQTMTLWEQLTGRAISGPLTGERLQPIFMTTTTWAEWSATHPDTSVIAIPGDEIDDRLLGAYSYEPGEAYSAYYAAERLWFPAETVEGGRDKQEILGVVIDGIAVAVDVDALAMSGPRILEFDVLQLIAVPTAGGGGRLYAGDGSEIDLAGAQPSDDVLTLTDGRTLPRVDATPAFWFAWAAAHPDSALWSG